MTKIYIVQDKNPISLSMGSSYIWCWWSFCYDGCYICCSSRGLFIFYSGGNRYALLSKSSDFWTLSLLLKLWLLISILSCNFLDRIYFTKQLEHVGQMNVIVCSQESSNSLQSITIGYYKKNRSLVGHVSSSRLGYVSTSRLWDMCHLSRLYYFLSFVWIVLLFILRKDKYEVRLISYYM